MIKVVVGGKNLTSVSDEDIKEELAKRGIIGEIEITRREGDVFENKNKLTNSDFPLKGVEKNSNSTKKKKNKKYWKKSQCWE